MEMSKHLKYFWQFVRALYNIRIFYQIRSQVDCLVFKSLTNVHNILRVPFTRPEIHIKFMPRTNILG